MGFNGAILFLDWGKAFGKIDQKLLTTALRTYGIPDKLNNLIKAMYKNPTFKVTIDKVDPPWMPQ